MKFLLDENVHKGLFSFLSKLGHDVKLSPKGIENGEVFELTDLESQKLSISKLLKQHSSEEFEGKVIKLLPDDFEFL